jgi:hypothetical protein
LNLPAKLPEPKTSLAVATFAKGTALQMRCILGTPTVST